MEKAPTPQGTAAEQLLAIALETGALRQGDFTLSAGGNTSYYFDGRKLSLAPKGIHLITQILLPILEQNGIDAAGGPTLGADPIVAALVFASNTTGTPLRGFIVRKKRKDHGTGELIEGHLRHGDKAAIIDDTCTTGRSLIQAIAAVENAGAKVVKVIALLDRDQGGGDLIKQMGYDFQALMTATQEGDFTTGTRHT